MSTMTLLAAAISCIFITATAFASQPDVPVRDLPDSGPVTLSGTVDKIGGGQNFVLRDTTGIVSVKMASEQPVALKAGQNVTVTGTVENHLWGLLGKDIVATNVQVR